jgi:DNA modification methylase
MDRESTMKDLVAIAGAHVLDSAHGPNYALYNADCVLALPGIPSNSIGHIIFSPPFASLYTYSNSPHDMGNCKNMTEFGKTYEHVAAELLRVSMPGRLCAVHCMQLPTSKVRDGYIGLQDFRGELIRIMQSKGWVYHSEVCIWKDPVTQMQRTHALGLLHAQIKKDSSKSRQGMADYLVIFYKPGDNEEPITNTDESFPVKMWQRYASPVWALVGSPNHDGFYGLTQDINPSKTLQRESARENDDERHICPLQLEVIERSLKLWSNPGDVILSPFAGIGSELYKAVEMGRRGIGFELKRIYFECASANIAKAEPLASGKQTSLLALMGLA